MLEEKKIPKPVFGNILMPGNAKVMYLGTVGQPPFPKFSKNRLQERYLTRMRKNRVKTPICPYSAVTVVK